MPRRVDPSQIATGAGSAIPGSVSASAVTSGDVGASSGTLDAHLADPSGAHPASAISIQDLFDRYISGDVEGALGELAALVPPSPGPIGSSGPPWLGSSNTGVPDWGVLKLWDGALSLSGVHTADRIYPYYWRAPISPTGDGVDPATDPIFNIVDGIYTGGGPGKAHAGFVTVSMNGGPADGFPSWRIISGTTPEVVVSGIVSPADRGVLALVKWDAGDLSAPAPAANVTDITDRCVAALLLGQGVSGSGGGSGGCDGAPGGIFTVGSPTPYDFPGQAAGQYDLDEIHSGVSRTAGPPPPANPSAGQVRLLTDPSAVSFSPGTIPGGMPIFGATSIATGGGTDGNFFAYRLPYLKDYSAATGLIYTPRTPFDESTRYFNTLAPAAAPTTTQAGNYDDFTADFWAIQVARYRHRFVLAAGVPVALRRDGSYALVHFRKEEYFEEYVRDGVAPTADKVFSINLVNWSGSAEIDNLVDLTVPTPTASPAYAVHTSEVSEDPNGTVVPTMPGPNNLFTFSALNATQVSGILYYKPLSPVTGGQQAAITMLDLAVTNVFNEGYRSHDAVPTAGPLFGDDRGEALNQCPVFLSLASFAYEGLESPESGTITVNPLAAPLLFPASLGRVKRQRIEFGFADLRPGGATNPAPADNAVVAMPLGPIGDRISFQGDPNTPAFTENAKVRVFVRRPQNTDLSSGYPLPTLPATGMDAIPTMPGSPKILYHSMADHTGVIFPTYGNATNAANVILNPTKDRDERFLDEVYRYPMNWEPLATTIPADAAQLLGPGLPGGFVPVMVPVQPVNGDPNYPGYYFQGWHTKLLDGTDPDVVSEAQVAGLPERNPPYTDGVDAPFPSRGVLIYPRDNYSMGYLPVNANYAVAVGDRGYQRCFDAGAGNVGASSFVMRFWGVTLSDFAYAGFGPGGADLACMVKIPGLTTWMDAGRVDGGGPSKQDPALDGAGCLVLGPNTFNAIDPASQVQYAQIEINIGPLASLFLNLEGKCPVLVKIIRKDTPAAHVPGTLDWQNVLPTAPTSACRGLVGIEILVP